MTEPKNIGPLVEETQRRAEEALKEACERTLYLVSSYPCIAEILKEVLWADSSILSDVFGWINEDDSGWRFNANWGQSVTAIQRRIEFANQFAGYEILDDGDPGIAYRRYYSTFMDDPPDLYGMRACSKDDEMAEPFITSSRDTFCEESNWIPSICNEESVLAVFREVEASEVRTLEWHLEDAIEGVERGEEGAKEEMEKIANDIRMATESMRADPVTKLIRQWMIENDIVPASKKN